MRLYTDLSAVCVGMCLGVCVFVLDFVEWWKAAIKPTYFLTYLLLTVMPALCGVKDFLQVHLEWLGSTEGRRTRKPFRLKALQGGIPILHVLVDNLIRRYRFTKLEDIIAAHTKRREHTEQQQQNAIMEINPEVFIEELKVQNLGKGERTVRIYSMCNSKCQTFTELWKSFSWTTFYHK